MKNQLRGFTIVELLVVIIIIVLLMLLLMPGMQGAREAARRGHCKARLMQIAAGVLSYEQAHGVLPPGSVNQGSTIQNEPDGYHVSWLVQALPFVGREQVYARFDFQQGVYASVNSTARSAPIALFLCPSASAPKNVAGSHFAACHDDRETPVAADNHGVFFLNSSLRSDDIDDGTRHTIFIGEKLIDAKDLGWASGTRATLRNTGTALNAALNQSTKASAPPATGDDNAAVGGFASMHPGGAHFAFGDGSVRFISSSVDQVIMQRLAHRSDGQVLGADEY